MTLGTRYTAESKNQAVNSMLNLLRENGFYNAQVEASVEYENSAEETNLTFTITPGKRARLTAPVITGEPGRSPASIVRATHWRRLYGLFGWQDLTQARLQQGLDNIRRYYEKRDLLRSQVTLTRLVHDNRNNTVTPYLNIRAGLPVAIETQGTHIRRGRLRQLVPIFQEQSVDADLLKEGQRNIQQFLQSQGYFGAKAEVTSETADSKPVDTITYTVDRGERHKFVSLTVTGNRYFSDQTIRERLYEVPAQLPRFPHGRFSYDILRTDIQAIRELYTSNGFRAVKVTSSIQDDHQGIRGHLAVSIHISEGPQFLVSSLSFQGLDDAVLRVVRSILTSTPGQPFSEVNVANDRDNILNYFYNLGYLSATFEYLAEPSPERNAFKLTYLVNPGTQTFVRDVIVTGLETTRPQLVDDQITLKKNEALSLTERNGEPAPALQSRDLRPGKYSTPEPGWR